MSTGFSDAALLLIGHGATMNRESAAPVYQHATALRARHLFAEVREAFWKQEPGIQAVLSSITARRIFAVPLFVSDGYFTEERIPAELGLCQPGEKEFARVRREGERTLYYCAPVGTHPSMTGVILARARAVVEKYPFPRAPQPEETALFIAGHGTSRNENSRCAIERQAQLIQSQRIYGDVQAVFIEEQPRIGECYALTRARHLVVVPFFISDGLHACEDIPVLLGEPEPIVRRRLEQGQPAWRNPTEKNGKLIWYAGSVGTEPGLADVIIERAKEVV